MERVETTKVSVVTSNLSAGVVSVLPIRSVLSLHEVMATMNSAITAMIIFLIFEVA